MTTASQVAALAALLADGTRAGICLALLDGRAWSAGELARHTAMAPSTVTEHLHRLVDGGLVSERRQGRHRYVQLADPSVASLLEDLAAHARGPAVTPRGLSAVTADAALRRGRTCYDHLAGRLGVAVTDAMTAAALLEQRDGFALTPAGIDWLTNKVGLDLERAGRRPIARACLDWTERRHHLAGLAGARLCEKMLTDGWIVRIGRGRAVDLTPTGRAILRDLLGLQDIE